MLAELTSLFDYAESSLKIYQYFHVLINKFDNLNYENFPPTCIIFNVVLNISPIVVQKNLPDCKMQYVGSPEETSGLNWG